MIEMALLCHLNHPLSMISGLFAARLPMGRSPQRSCMSSGSKQGRFGPGGVDLLEELEVGVIHVQQRDDVHVLDGHVVLGRM